MIEGITEPQFDTWGMGLTHMAQSAAESDPCGRCHATGFVGHSSFPIPCPECGATGSVKK